MANNTKLAATNKNLVAMVKKLTNEIKNLKRETSCLKKGGQSGWGPTLCHHCKKEGYHAPEACYELVKNKDKRPHGWRSSLWRCGTVRINSKISISSNKLLTHHAKFSPTLDKPLPSSLDTTPKDIVDSGLRTSTFPPIPLSST